MPSEIFQLPYGRGRFFECRLDPGQLAGAIRPPEPLTQTADAAQWAIENPIDFPPLRQALVGGDHVTVVLDRRTPQAEQVLLGLWRVLAAAGVAARHLHVVQPADLRGGPAIDPRSALPAEVRAQSTWRIHDPLAEEGCGYLATSAGGERIYLARDLLDADLVICVGSIEYDPVLGYRGTLSSVYPGLSNAESIRKSLGGGHEELNPDHPRPLRELADEVGWLLGVQFAVQVIPSSGGGAADVLAGLVEPVFTRGKQRLRAQWQFTAAERPELVLVSVDADAGGHSWRQLAAALDTARRIVARDGRIVALTELADAPSEGLELIRDARTPHEALRPIRERALADRTEALQIALALDRANVYLLSCLADDLVESLFMVPLGTPQEASRVLEGVERCAVIGSAQHAYVRHEGSNA